MKLSALIASLNVSTLQSLLCQNHEWQFWKLYLKVRSSRYPNVMDQNLWSQLHEHRSYISKLVFAIFIHLACIAGFSSDYNSTPKLTLFWAITGFLTLINVIRNGQMILCMELIRIEVEHLEKDLITLNEFIQWETPNVAFPQFDEFIRLRIVEKQKIYEDIFGMSQSFQEACNWSMVVHLLRGYIRVLVEFYFCIFLGMKTWKPMQDLLLVPAILEIPMFLLTAKSCMNAAKYISYRVHNLKHSADNIAASVQIQNFSLQILHQQIKIDGLGIASMDGYMLTKAVGSITTYMVFFIQFMPKFKSKFD
ncbi:gustatory receptor 8a [Eupeodes corollae]|uniref:gustatory receptor 8a n=1 Tax=Eupeodes corollae TaxID=290404 RepID=UPI002490DD5E|nr:gustatory receptor 8a [Eupeodes corollae]